MSDPRSLLERESRRFTQTDGAFERLERRRARKHRNQRIQSGVLGVVVAIAVGWLGINAIRSAPPVPVDHPDFGIFAPLAGRIVYGDSGGIYGVDPSATELARVKLTSEPGSPLGWSRDGTRLLILQQVRDGEVVAQDRDALRLVVLDADGSQTQLVEREGWITGATISPDGSRVVFGTYQGLYSVDVDGGRPELLLDGGEDELERPTFSPDGSRIAYVAGSGDHSHRVWVMGADGSDPHEILANETTMGAGHVLGLEWSPGGDLIAFGNDVDTYTFAPDGSGFTKVLSNGTSPFWSPDGSRLAYVAGREFECPADTCGLFIADADGSNPRVGFGRSGPWHPGEQVTERSRPN